MCVCVCVCTFINVKFEDHISEYSASTLRIDGLLILFNVNGTVGFIVWNSSYIHEKVSQYCHLLCCIIDGFENVKRKHVS